MNFQMIRNNDKVRFVYTLVSVVLAGFMQAAVMQIFMTPINLLSSGFTGVAILLEKITSTFWGFSFPVSLGMLVLNIPVAILCSKSISRRFTFFSLVQVFFASFFLRVLDFEPLFDDVLLNVIFGGFLYGIMTVIALKGNASTGGVDFVALYISNRRGKSIWSYVFVFNATLITIFGFMFGWEYAGYSILFQFISTKTIDSFYHRYERMTMQITTTKPDEVIQAYVAEYRHGVSRVDGIGGNSGQKETLLHTVASSYEIQDIAKLMHRADPHVVINTFKSEDFYGGFYLKPIE